MPITAAKGQINLSLEQLANQGLQPLLTNAAPTSSMSLTTQPVTSIYMGARLVVWVFNAPAAGNGTFTIAGLDFAGNAITEGPITVPAPNVLAQNSTVGKFEYVTTHAYASVNSNGVTTTNLSGTNATISILAAQAGKELVPGVLKAKKQLKKFSPNEHRNLLDRDSNRVQTRNECTVDELSQTLYPENSLYAAYMMTGSVPTVTTLPASPTSLLASTAVSGSPLSLGTQPTGPGMFLIMSFSGTSVAGTVALSGTAPGGATISETVTIPASNSGNYYSANCYASIAASGITITGLTAGSITITGVFGWKYVFTPGDTVYSASIEAFTGVDSFIMPWVMFEDFELDFGMDKELALKLKGITQDRLVIGSRTTNPLNSNRIVALAQPSDLPMTGWSGLVYIDTSWSGSPSTQYGDLISGKINLKSPQKPNWTLTNSQNFNRVNRGKRESMFDAKIDLTNMLQWEQYRQNILQFITFQFYGPLIGGGNTKTWQFTFPCSWDDFDIDSEPSKEHVEASVKSTAQYNSTLGGAYLLTVICQQPPNYTL